MVSEKSNKENRADGEKENRKGKTLYVICRFKKHA
jgi:hypothetical protein